MEHINSRIWRNTRIFASDITSLIWNNILKKMILNAYLVGITILVTAIIYNIIFKKIKKDTWYDYINKIKQQGFINATKKQNLNLINLYLMYPLTLGIISYFLVLLLSQ